MSDKMTFEEFFAQNPFGLLDKKEKRVEKTDEDRLIERFEVINKFVDRTGHAPTENMGDMSEMNLSFELEGIRADKRKKEILRPHDRHQLLDVTKPVSEEMSFGEFFAENPYGLLDDTESDLSIYDFKHVATPDERRAKADKVAKRRPMSEEEFAPFAPLFDQVHEELKLGIRKQVPFVNPEVNIKSGRFFVADGILCYVVSTNVYQRQIKDSIRLDGRIDVVFANQRRSDMFFRSLAKTLNESGFIVTGEPMAPPKEDQMGEHTGTIYVVKTKSEAPELAKYPNLYKVGFTMKDVHERLKNASREKTFLYHDVELIQTYNFYNLNTQVAERLLHQFFHAAQLTVMIHENNNWITPREWFDVPLSELDKAIKHLISGDLHKYRYDFPSEKVVPKDPDTLSSFSTQTM